MGFNVASVAVAPVCLLFWKRQSARCCPGPWDETCFVNISRLYPEVVHLAVLMATKWVTAYEIDW